MVSLKPREVNMLEGSLVKSILVYSFPLIVSNLLQTLYSTADMVIVAMSDTEGAVGSIGITGTLINLIIHVFIGFSVGANAIVSRHIGARDGEKAGRAAHTAILMSLIFGLAGAVVGIVICRPVLTLMGNEGYVLAMATEYSVIRFLGIPFLSLTNFCIAIYRAKGDTKTPLYIMTLSGLANVLMNMLFVLGLGMDVDGVAWATVLSQVLSAAFLLLGLFRTSGWCRLSFRSFRICREDFLGILRIGLPAGLQGALYSVSNLLISSSVISVNNRLCPGGSAVLDGNSAASNVGDFVTTIADAMMHGCVSFTSQHYGAKKFRRMGRMFLDFFLITQGIIAVLLVLVMSFREPLLHLYISDPIAMETATIRMNYMLCTYFLGASMSLFSGMLRGLDKSTSAAMITLIFTCLLRIVWIFTVFERLQTLQSIYISYPLSWGIAAIFHLLFAMVVWNRLKKKYPEPVLKGA